MNTTTQNNMKADTITGGGTYTGQLWKSRNEIIEIADRLAKALAIAYIWRHNAMPRERKDMIESAINEWDNVCKGY